MIPPEANSWSKERISQEIQNRRQYIQTLEESIRHHMENYDRFPDDGFQGHGLESEKTNLEYEILKLTELIADHVRKISLLSIFVAQESPRFRFVGSAHRDIASPEPQLSQ